MKGLTKVTAALDNLLDGLGRLEHRLRPMKSLVHGQRDGLDA